MKRPMTPGVRSAVASARLALEKATDEAPEVEAELLADETEPEGEA